MKSKKCQKEEAKKKEGESRRSIVSKVQEKREVLEPRPYLGKLL